jgi:hypothetical protein
VKHLFIINPAAGSKDRTEKYRREIETICGRENDMACPDSLSGETRSEHEAKMDIMTIIVVG